MRGYGERRAGRECKHEQERLERVKAKCPKDGLCAYCYTRGVFSMVLIVCVPLIAYVCTVDNVACHHETWRSTICSGQGSRRGVSSRRGSYIYTYEGVRPR